MQILLKYAGLARRLADSALLQLAGLVIILVAPRWIPPDGIPGGACIARRATGVDCPGCGLTRAFSALTHGHLAAAVRLHPLSPTIYAFFLLLALNRVMVVVNRRPLLQSIEAPGAFSVLSLGLLATWLCRFTGPG